MDLDAIEARANAATEGPWEYSGLTLWGRDNLGLIKATTPEDRTFTAAARTDVPALVARVRELEGENDLLRRQLQAARGERPGTWDTWEEHAARKQATPAEPPVKRRLSLEEARLQAARAHAHGTD